MNTNKIIKKSSFKKRILKEILKLSPQWFMYWWLFLLLLILVIYVWFFVIMLMTMFTWAKSDPSTSLTYFQAEDYYWLPYKASFKKDNNNKYDSIFNNIPSLTKKHSDIWTEVASTNIKINNILKKYKVKDILPNNCKTYCDNKLSDIYSIKLINWYTYQLWNNNYNKIINVSTWNETSYINLQITSKKDWKIYNNYYYDKLDDTFDKSVLLSKENWYNTLFLKNKTEINKYSHSFNDLYKEKKNWTLSWKYFISNAEYNSTYFLSKDNFITSLIHNAWITDPIFKRYIILETLNYTLDTDSDFKTDIQNTINYIIHFNEDKIKNSALVDMLNFAWVKSPQTRKSSLSNQFLLSQEKINLWYFNNTKFGKDYKHIKLKSKDLTSFTDKDAQKILHFRAWWVDENSNKFWYNIAKEAVYDIKSWNIWWPHSFKVINKDNSKEIIKNWNLFYSPKLTYSNITNWRSNKNWCEVLYPEKSVWDYVTYTKEALYTWQEVRVHCIVISKNAKWKSIIKHYYYNYQAEPLIQETEVTFYKTFIFDDENKKSIRKREDYFLNYFYDKEYIDTQWWKISKTAISKINNIYLDKQSIILKWVYVKVKGFWIEAKWNWSFITSKKSFNWYDILLPDAPVNIEIWLLTDLNKKDIKNIQTFEANSLINNPNYTPKQLLIKDKTKGIDLTNSFFQKYQYSQYQWNNTWNQDADLTTANFFISNSSKLTPKQYSILDIYIQRKFNDLKNSYFYTMPQNKKFASILDDIYDIKWDNINKINIFKKYLILFSDITTNPKYRNLLFKNINNIEFKWLFNYKTNSAQLEWRKQYTKTFDKCYGYTSLDSAYTKLYQKDYPSIDINNTKVNADLVTPCYTSYLPNITVTVELNKNKTFTDIKKKELEKKIYDELEYNRIHTTIADPRIYKFLIDDNYNVIIDNLEKNSQIYTMFNNTPNKYAKATDSSWNIFTKIVNQIKSKYKEWQTQKTIEKNIETVLKNSNLFFLYDSNLDYLFWKYKETKEYTDSCNPNTETLLNSPLNNNFKCSLDSIYDEFLTNITNNKQYYYYIKEEYLKEKVRDQPFYSYYNDFSQIKDHLDFVSWEINSKLSSNKYVPLNNSRYYAISQDSPYMSHYQKVNIDNTKINDFTYFFDLNKSFSFQSENYLSNINLHTIPLNPNLYLHAFIAGIKKRNTDYTVNVYGNWFKGVNNSENKKVLEKNYMNDLWTFILNKVTNKKVLDDLKDVTILNKLWVMSFDIFPIIKDYSQFLTNVTVWNNIENYINNVTFSNSIESITNESFNNDAISNYDLLIKQYKVNKNSGIVSDKRKQDILRQHLKDSFWFEETLKHLLTWESLSKDLTDGRWRLMNKYWYSIYVLQLLDQHYKEEWIYINQLISGNVNSYESLVDSLIQKEWKWDIVAQLYKDVLLYTWWYMDKSDFSKIYFFGKNIDSWWVDTIHDVLLEMPEDMYTLSKYYDVYNDNNWWLTPSNYNWLHSAIHKLKSPDYMSKISSLYSKTTINDKWETIFMWEKWIKEEKVLLLQLYYNDFYKNLLKISNDYISPDYWSNNKVKTVDMDIYTTLIKKQLTIIKLLKKEYPEKYYKYYLWPIHNKKDLNWDELIELRDLYKNVILKEYWINTNLKDYQKYIELIKAWLKKDGINLYWNIPFSKFNWDYQYAPTSKDWASTWMVDVRNWFLKSNKTDSIPLYNMLNDLFVFNSDKNITKIIKISVKNKMNIDLNMNKLKIQNNKKLINDIKNGNTNSSEIAAVKKKINLITKAKKNNDNLSSLAKNIFFIDSVSSNITYNILLSYYNWKLEKLQQTEVTETVKSLNYQNDVLNKKNIQLIKTLSELSEEEQNKLVYYNILIQSWGITITKVNNVKEQDKKQYEKTLFFKWPFSPTNNIWFVVNNYWSATDEELVQNLTNSYIWLSFIINNLKTTEDGLKNIVNELSTYSTDVSNDKVDSLPNFKNLWVFSPYYTNNWYVSTNWSDTLRFEMVWINDNISNYNNNSHFSVVSIQDRMTHEILSKNFENLKTTYCKTLSTSSDQQTCVQYMSYLQTLNSSELKWELEYITMILYVKKTPAKKYEFTKSGPKNDRDPLRYTYNSLANNFSKNSVIYQYFKEKYVENRQLLWQCTWYAAFLKTTETWQSNWTWNGRTVASSIWEKWYPTNSFNPHQDNAETLLKKIQPWDVISFNWYNASRNSTTHNSYCNTNTPYWHVWVVLKTDYNKKTVTIAEMNMRWTYSVDQRDYKVTKLCPWKVAHGLKWRY